MAGIFVSSGVTSNALVLSNGAALTVLSGGTALATVVSAGGIAAISGGGSAIGTLVQSRGLVEVLSGGVTSFTAVSGYGAEAVYGAALGTTVGYAASQTVFAGGTAIVSLVEGSEIVASGGVTSGADVLDGEEIVAAGGVVSDTVVAYSSGAVSGNGQILVASGGIMDGAVVNHDGYADLSAGAVAIGTTLDDGDVGVEGGTAIDTTIGIGGVETVSVVYVFSTGVYASGLASATTIAGGTLALEGGSATGGIVFAGSGPGLLDIGGTVMPATAISGFAASDAIDLQSLTFTSTGTVSLDASTDVLTVTEGGSSIALQLAGIAAGTRFDLASDTVSGTILAIDTGSTTAVSSGITSSGIGLTNGAVLTVLAGGTVVSTTVSAGGLATVSGGGSAIGTIVMSRGLEAVLPGGVASGTVVSAYGADEVSGVATATVVAYAASQTVFSGGTAVGSLVDGTEIVSAGGVTSGAVLIDGTEIVSSGGVASATIVAASSGGIAGNGEMGVASGGTMLGAVIDRDGYAYLSAGALAVGTILSGGNLALGGGTAITTTIASGGVETVGAVYVFSTGADAVGLASATTIDGGTLDLAGGSATGGIVFTGSGPGLLEITGTLMPSAAIGGFAASDAIDLQGVIFAGSASGSLDASTDVLTVAEGGSSVALQLAGSYAGITFDLSPDTGSGTLVTIDNGGTVAVASGVTSSGLVLSNGAVLTVLSGGTAVSVTVSAGGVADIAGGGFAIDTQVNSRGLDEVQSGGVTRHTEVSAYGGEAVYGTAIGTTVLYAASQTVFAGGTALGSLVDGSEIVGAGGVTSGVDLVDGAEFVGSGGVASATVVAYASGADVADGEILVASGGLMTGVVAEHDGYAYLSIGALGFGTILSGGDLALGGGTAIDTTIGIGGLESVSVTYVFSTGDYYSGVASATTIDGGTLDLDGGIATGGIVFTGSGPGLLEISGTVMPGTAISGFAGTDAIDLQSVAFADSGTASLDAATDVLTVTEGGSSLALQLAGSYAGTVFDLSPDTGAGTVIRNAASGAVIGTSDVPCFAAGTRLATARGEIAVEQLVVGDLVMTPDGGTRPITWIGSRRVDCRRHPAPGKVWPVLIAADAFGDGAPRRDLRLSPDHAVYAEGVLIPVRCLINGTSIRQRVTALVRYFHVELERHDLLLAEGLAVESYLDTGDRGAFEMAEAPMTLHPVFGSGRGDVSLLMDALGYAPLRVTGRRVAAVRARLAERAAQRVRAASPLNLRLG
jgi:autotransporter passenger strand-loop-strand repeat protein